MLNVTFYSFLLCSAGSVHHSFMYLCQSRPGIKESDYSAEVSFPHIVDYRQLHTHGRFTNDIPFCVLEVFIEPASPTLIVFFVSHMRDPSHMAASPLAACRVLLLANTKGRQYIVRSIRARPQTLRRSVHLSPRIIYHLLAGSSWR